MAIQKRDSKEKEPGHTFVRKFNSKPKDCWLRDPAFMKFPNSKTSCRKEEAGGEKDKTLRWIDHIQLAMCQILTKQQ